VRKGAHTRCTRIGEWSGVCEPLAAPLRSARCARVAPRVVADMSTPKTVSSASGAVGRTRAADARTDVASASSEALALMTAGDLAAQWGVRSKHVLALARDGGLPHVKLGRYTRFRPESVQRWLDEREDEI
jgi:excisionase family DNA binding protein